MSFHSVAVVQDEAVHSHLNKIIIIIIIIIMAKEQYIKRHDKSVCSTAL